MKEGVPLSAGTAAARSSSSCSTASEPCLAAMCSTLGPHQLRGIALMLAPASSSARTHSTCVLPAAMCSTVPSLCSVSGLITTASVSAPAASSARTTAV
eukprot:761-Heterococcus_DN1.PRE.4